MGTASGLTVNKNGVSFTYLQPGLAGRAGFNLYKSLREKLL